MASDSELLRQYAEMNSQDAFAELVRRHLDLVYSVALRQVNGDAHLAQDVSQGVVTDLARKAASLSSHPSLTGWLYTSAYFAGCKAARAEQRRRVREQEAQSMHELLQSTTDEDWTRVQPVLDQAMHELKAQERMAILMRYFENRTFSEIGVQLGLSEDAARKRVDRALSKLQMLLSKRGIATSATLASALSASAIQSAPAGLAPLLTAASLSSAASQPGSITLLLKLMAASKLQTAVLSALVLASVLTPFALHQQAQARLHAQDEALRQQTNQLAQLTAENQRLAGLADQTRSFASVTPNASHELLKLRNEVSQLHRTLHGMTNPPAAPLLSPADKLAQLRQRSAARAAQLKQWLADHPSENIPELQQAAEENWIDAVSSLEEDHDFARAMSKLRFGAEVSVLNELRLAWQKYAANHSDAIPSNLAELKPYLDAPIDDAVLQRYALVHGKSLVSPLDQVGDWVITQAAPVNAALDSRFVFGLKGINNIAGEGITNRWNLVH